MNRDSNEQADVQSSRRLTQRERLQCSSLYQIGKRAVWRAEQQKRTTPVMALKQFIDIFALFFHFRLFS